MSSASIKEEHESIVFFYSIQIILTAIIAYISLKILQRKIDVSNDIICYSSCMIAASRAIETSQTKNPLIQDPLAEILAGTKAIEEKKRQNINVSRIAIRTKYFDDFIQDKITKEHIQQVVLIGAGMDSRVFRLQSNDSVAFYELDHASVLDLKQTRLDQVEDETLKKMILAGEAKRNVIPCNMERSSWSKLLLKSGFDKTKSTIWVLEGFTYYVSEPTIQYIFTTMHALSLPNTTCFIASVSTAQGLKRAKQSNSALMQSWKWGTDEPNDFFSNLNWDVTDVVQFGSDKANYGRFQPTSNDPRGTGIMYVTATISSK